MTLRGKKYAIPQDTTLVADLQRTDTRPYELVVLSSIFNESDAKILSRAANHNHFTTPEYVAVHRAFNALVRADQQVTHESVVMELVSSGSMNSDEAKNIVDTLSQATPPRSIRHAVRALGKVQRRHKLYDLAEFLTTPDAVRGDLEEAQAKMHDFLAVSNSVSGRSVSNLTQTLQKVLEREGQAKTWAPGFGALDEYWKIRKGSYTIIAAQSGHGKTSALCAMALNVAKQDTHVGVISIEMMAEELTFRMAAMEVGLDAGRVEDNLLSDPEKEMIRHHLAHNADVYDRVHIIDPSHVLAEDLPGLYNELSKEYGCEVVFVDYVQRISTKDRNMSGGYDRVSKASEVLTECTKSTGVATIALSVLARDRDTKKKGLDHLKGTGQLGADAHTVVIMTMDETTDPALEDRVIEFRSAKNRKGPHFCMNMILHGPTQRFRSPSESQFPPSW